MYQLRGRVSRGTQKGEVYFLSNTDSCSERLRLLLKHNEAGSGWILARKDMELRGIGGMLGTKQSGHFCDIGADMIYQIKQEIDQRAIMIDIYHMRYVIPDSYMQCDEERVYWYKQLAHIDTLADLEHAQAKIHERHGVEPDEVQDFWKFYELKFKARDLGIKSICGGKACIKVAIYNSSKVQFFDNIQTLADLEVVLDNLQGGGLELAVTASK